MILYEHPFNERTRYMIRLEYLFKQLFEFSRLPEPMYQHVAFSILFEILDVCERGDCRNWVIQEIEKQKINLESLRNHPDVQKNLLDDTLNKLNRVSKNLTAVNKLGGHMRESEWLMSLRNRFVTPGATSPMDSPSYNAWMNGSESERLQVMRNLVDPFMPLYDAIAMSLMVLREAAEPTEEVTGSSGVFEKSVGGRIYQMVRVWLPTGDRIYPEMSGNKYVVMIRFFKINKDFEQSFIKHPIQFKMALCHV